MSTFICLTCKPPCKLNIKNTDEFRNSKECYDIPNLCPYGCSDCHWIRINRQNNKDRRCLNETV